MCGPKVASWVGDILKDLCHLFFFSIPWLQTYLNLKVLWPSFTQLDTNWNFKMFKQKPVRNKDIIRFCIYIYIYIYWANLIWKHLDVMRTIHPLMIQHIKMGEYVEFTQTRHEFLTTRHTLLTFQVLNSMICTNKNDPKFSHSLLLKGLMDWNSDTQT